MGRYQSYLIVSVSVDGSDPDGPDVSCAVTGSVCVSFTLVCMSRDLTLAAETNNTYSWDLLVPSIGSRSRFVPFVVKAF